MGTRAVLIAAVASGQGKTTVTAALARKLVRAGRRVRVFKCGPDFIDPMVLGRASGAPVESLDLWMVGRERCQRLLAQAALEADDILIEGVMGLYDGTPSAADLAREFGVPVLAVIDAGAMAQTAGALVHGLRDYGPVTMAGVIANRVGSAGHAAMVKTSLRDIALFATLPKQGRSLPERHLGLVLPDEVDEVDEILDELADQLVFDAAAWDALPQVAFDMPAPETPVAATLAGKTVAIARDAAFVFVYAANLEVMRRLGADIVYFSPLADEPVPPEADAVYLPGGYPELHAPRLAAAATWRASIRAAHADGVPILAECGGMMALAESLDDGATATDTDVAAGTAKPWPMAGLLPGRVVVQKRLAGLGPQAMPTPQGTLRGHTFHYSRLETQAPVLEYTSKNPSGAQGEAVYRIGSLTASYFHGYFPSNPEAAAAMLSRKAP
jgi:cobyrinic acid a,c-diamide synthase